MSGIKCIKIKMQHAATCSEIAYFCLPLDLETCLRQVLSTSLRRTSLANRRGNDPRLTMLQLQKKVPRCRHVAVRMGQQM